LVLVDSSLPAARPAPPAGGLLSRIELRHCVLSNTALQYGIRLAAFSGTLRAALG
jgi:hypothetical protein